MSRMESTYKNSRLLSRVKRFLVGDAGGGGGALGGGGRRGGSGGGGSGGRGGAGGGGGGRGWGCGGWCEWYCIDSGALSQT